MNLVLIFAATATWMAVALPSAVLLGRAAAVGEHEHAMDTLRHEFNPGYTSG
ncbi:hypothetical protein ACPW96_17740 [Micromonospora sp. DT81.3]|uniref:hypothetical protein n=1 Tax=Actinomycetes TaxID=1760 RepID=UPI003CF013B6